MLTVPRCKRVTKIMETEVFDPRLFRVDRQNFLPRVAVRPQAKA